MIASNQESSITNIATAEEPSASLSWARLEWSVGTLFAPRWNTPPSEA
jgi:hypothetical protein